MDALEWGQRIDLAAAAARLEGVVEHTPLVPFDLGASELADRVELRLKCEQSQVNGAFKSRGAWNSISQLTPEERKLGVVATSSGNHATALAWAAARAGVHATVFMPEDSYPNKIQACRDHGAEVVLTATRAEAEERCAEQALIGRVLVHPYNCVRTIEGQGTVGLEIAQDWPEVELVMVPTGGGGLLAGVALAISRTLGDEVAVVGVEPEGGANMSAALEASEPVTIDPITTKVQGLCPPNSGEVNVRLAERYVEGMVALSDDEIFAGQAELVRAGFVVEPAGAAAFAATRLGMLPEGLFEDRRPGDRLRVVCILTGANADPDQLASLGAASADDES
ncbi:MAG: threonine dehydratase [Planctomycetota bacterium]|jgi:threonine dehydratase